MYILHFKNELERINREKERLELERRNVLDALICALAFSIVAFSLLPYYCSSRVVKSERDISPS